MEEVFWGTEERGGSVTDEVAPSPDPTALLNAGNRIWSSNMGTIFDSVPELAGKLDSRQAAKRVA